MPVRKSQQKAVNKYVKNNYDRVSLVLKQKGYLDEIKAHAKSQEESVNAFITRAISETMERDDQRLTAISNEQKNITTEDDILNAAKQMSDYVYGVFNVLNKNFKILAHTEMISMVEDAVRQQVIDFDIDLLKSHDPYYNEKSYWEL